MTPAEIAVLALRVRILECVGCGTQWRSHRIAPAEDVDLSRALGRPAIWRTACRCGAQEWWVRRDRDYFDVPGTGLLCLGVSSLSLGPAQ